VPTQIFAQQINPELDENQWKLYEEARTTKQSKIKNFYLTNNF
jgi:hypothetical protein